jgi:hypothetical protein
MSNAVERWWPLPDSLDLVRAPIGTVAAAVLTEVTRFVAGEQLSSGWVPFSSLDQLFGSVAVFTNVPTVYFVLPTRSEWTVLWNNSFLCDGYDSLCWCLTMNHALCTMHWQSSDEDAVFQAGSSFTFRRKSQSGLSERSVYCGKNDQRWEFHAIGEPLSEEDLASYAARRKRDRLNEHGMLKLLDRLGAHPWNDDFYPAGEAFRIERVAFPETISQKKFKDFACPRAEARRQKSEGPAH